ncbi:repressor LexA [Candidatus Berkelbacteria bacterium CG_4_9_14_3_um_filter_39_23]|uniref:LexA repressor n=2 Tax=Candidatus Berkelbacteria TaxID=1618330 RepID=A0A2M7CJ58_9BACT|nr:transcriptional repressor LexA [Candidatus Berkelbacteria bacterium]OIP05327.1 MAG: repressor LexA [Candidatus Berkelbacteria bacterium CG2_30_39_44]PIR27903.1 MAG: repressor LexA [Candidatus Berkelbacteria bacterium CG11_big_fil_rev_8_21_14_0_20_40_23]PIV25650.1 MAG: repressor LexA [Candidatus Berkelbacteria bacterium CG03_land_8_20_14_0_80_40_36]PIX30695.1 MAG: repressor LexA [Candidatus Berkelbacteria bacterium CG_4_8_14_3_um_filter_39_27]PIZ28629.1 MAG: repressor LexA [Candidatus Berkel
MNKTKTKQLTKRQSQILNYVKTYLEKHEYAPSFREIASGLKLSSIATISDHIQNLKEKGYLTSAKNLARSIQLTPTWDERTFSIPLLGTVVAGSPIQAIRTHETINIPRDMMKPNVFALKVRGDSMIDDGIYEGDYVIIEKIVEPKNGDIVVSLLDNENVTLKRFFKEKDHIRLQPANSNYAPIRVKQVTIQGRVLGVIRKFA